MTGTACQLALDACLQDTAPSNTTIDAPAGGPTAELWPGKRQIVRWKDGDKRFEPLAQGVGAARLLTGDAKRVYWLDGFRGALMAAPR